MITKLVGLPSDYQLVNKPDYSIGNLVDRPAVIIALILTVFLNIMIFGFGLSLNFTLLIFLIFTPILPAFILEGKWLKAIKLKSFNARHEYDLVKTHRLTFVFAGFVFSFIQFLVGIFLQQLLFGSSSVDLFQDYSATIIQIQKPGLLAIILYILATFIIGVYIAASFYRIRSEDEQTGIRYNYISSSSQIITLTSYAMMPINLNMAILWIFQVLNDGNPDQINTNPLYFITSGIILPFLIMNLVLFLSVFYSAIKLPKYIYGSLYTKPKFNEVRRFLIRFIPIILLLSWILEYMMNNSVEQLDLVNYWYIIIMVIPVIVILRLSSRLKFGGKTCISCNLSLDDKGLCPSCDKIENNILPIKLSLNTNIQHPYCPSCGTLWNQITRKCNKCGFSIVLTCGKCSQTLNPLWEKCNQCGERRKPIPQIALQSPGSPSFARNQTFLMILLALIIPAMILQISITLTTIKKIEDGIFSRANYTFMYDDIGRILVLLLTVISAFYIIIVSFNEKKRPVMLIANRIATSAGSILILMATMLLVSFTLKRVFTEGFDGLFVRLLSFLLSFIFFTYSIYNYYKSLINFRPLIGFDTHLAFDHINIEEQSS